MLADGDKKGASIRIVSSSKKVFSLGAMRFMRFDGEGLLLTRIGKERPMTILGKGVVNVLALSGIVTGRRNEDVLGSDELVMIAVLFRLS